MPSMSVGVAWDRRAGRESIGYIPPATHLATIAAGALGYECGIAWREGCDLGTASSRLSGNRVLILCQLSDSVFAIALCCRRFRRATAPIILHGGCLTNSPSRFRVKGFQLAGMSALMHQMNRVSGHQRTRLCRHSGCRGLGCRRQGEAEHGSSKPTRWHHY